MGRRHSHSGCETHACRHGPLGHGRGHQASNRSSLPLCSASCARHKGAGRPLCRSRPCRLRLLLPLAGVRPLCCCICWPARHAPCTRGGFFCGKINHIRLLLLLLLHRLWELLPALQQLLLAQRLQAAHLCPPLQLSLPALVALLLLLPERSSIGGWRWRLSALLLLLLLLVNGQLRPAALHSKDACCLQAR